MYEFTVTLSKEFLNLLTNCFLDYICGDKCLEYRSKCECGDSIFDGVNLYCCISHNETCKVQGMWIKLSNID